MALYDNRRAADGLQAGCRWDRAAAARRCGLGSVWRARARLSASPAWASPVSAVLHRRGGLFFSVREGARLCANLAALWLDIGGGSGALRGRYADGAKRRFGGQVSRRLCVKRGAVVICASVVQEWRWRNCADGWPAYDSDYMTRFRRGAVRGLLTLFRG